GSAAMDAPLTATASKIANILVRDDEKKQAGLLPPPRLLRRHPSSGRRGGLTPITYHPSRLLSLEQQLHHLRRDFRGALIELRIGQVGDRVRHLQELEVRQPPRAGHGLAGCPEDVRDEGRRRNAVLFENDTVEHTARRARPSVAHAGD